MKNILSLVLSFLCVVASAMGPGLLQGRLKNQTDTTTPYTEWTETVIVPGAMYATTTSSFEHNGVTYPTMPGDSGFGYHGFMRMKGGVPYRFLKNFDDNGYVTVNGTSLISDTDWQAVTISPPFTPTADGWYEIDVRLGQGGGGVGPSGNILSYIGSGIAWNTNGLTTVDFSNEANWGNWHPLVNGESDVYLYPMYPFRSLDTTVSTDENGAKVATLSIGASGLGSASTVRLYSSNTAETDEEWASAASSDLGTVGADACEFTTPPFAGAGTTATRWRLAVVDEIGMSWSPTIIVRDEPTVSVVRSALTPLFVRWDATLDSAGRGHSAAAVSFAFGKGTAGAYETMTNALPAGESLSILRTGLEPGATYEWKFLVVNAAGKQTETTGSFTAPTDEGPGTGGTRTDLGNDEYVHVFSAATGGEFAFTAPSVPVLAEVLAVGGGGAGGVIGGGGGAGGFVLASNVVLSGSYRVTVGAGGAWPMLDSPSYSRSGPRYDGKDTILTREDGAVVVLAHGGGGGGSASTAAAKGNDGGSGGGASGEEIATGGNSLDDQGNPGGSFASAMPGASAGGGGAGEPGGLLVNKDSGSGGAGLPCSITGTEVWYAGGGGGGVAADWHYGYKPGAGGKGGGGKGGAHLSNEDGHFGEPGENGTDGLGGGGGGSSGKRDNQGLFRPGNGGSGILVVRYTLTDVNDPTPRIRLVGVDPNSDATAVIRWDIPFAGPDTSLCDVTATWSEDLSTASFTTLLASGTAGPDQAALPNLLPGRSYEVFITARNGLAGGVATSKTLRFTMPANGAMPQTFQPAQPVVGSFTCVNSTDGPFADLEGTLLQPGTGCSYEDCSITVYVGTENALPEMEKRAVAAVPDANGKFAFRLEDIPLDALVYATVEVSNGAEFIDRLGTSFRTYADSTLKEPSASSDQLVVTFRDEVQKIGCGTTTAWFRWSADDGKTWEETQLGTFSPTDPTNGWTVVRTAPAFNREIHYEFFCSNAIAVHSVSNSIVSVDRSVYRWNPTLREGNWNSSSSWLCDSPSAVGYPTAGSTADFSEMTGRVRVLVPDDVAVHSLRLDKGNGSFAENVDLKFVGKEGGTFSIDNFGGESTVRMKNSQLTFQGVHVQFPGDYTLNFGARCTLSLLDGAVMRANLVSSADDFTLELTGNSCLHSKAHFKFTGKNPRIFLSDCGFLETTGQFNFGNETRVYMEGRNPAMQAVDIDKSVFVGTATIEVSLPKDVYGEDFIRWDEDPEHPRGWYCDEVGQRRAIVRAADRDGAYLNFAATMTFHIDSGSPGRNHGGDKDYLLLDFRSRNYNNTAGITDTNKVSVTGLREGEYTYWKWPEDEKYKGKPNPPLLFVHIKSNPATVLLFR